MKQVRPTIKDDPAASEWYHDLYRSTVINRNRWFLIGVVSIILAGIEGIALLSLTPLKSVEPYILQVDSQGITNVLKPLREGSENSLTEVEAVTKSFIVKYVIGRETYDPQDLNRNYDLIRLMSSSEESERFNNSIANGNPSSPVERYKSTTTRTVKISSVSFLDKRKKTAQVRFSTTENSRNEHRENFWVSILTFRYVNTPMDENDRLNNPLGFQVVTYRVDQEIVK